MGRELPVENLDAGSAEPFDQLFLKIVADLLVREIDGHDLAVRAGELIIGQGHAHRVPLGQGIKEVPSVPAGGLPVQRERRLPSPAPVERKAPGDAGRRLGRR